MNLKSDAYCNRIRPHTIIYDRIRQSYSSVYGVQTVTLKSLRIFIRSPYTVSISHRFTPYTVPVYGFCVRPPYVSVLHRKRSFTTVYVRPGILHFLMTASAVAKMAVSTRNNGEPWFTTPQFGLLKAFVR